ncbi:hypothetical protein BJ875DRAFT_529749 [Amylocarpus encephaloides]|uniref:NmrA-like domain-containing protein n=1 Tax=Amylocarpus encephaloides TaxID=45428 RepID=A0A9P8C5Z3_9HELO|nr:hypothetical protein BJ875DRAFT_529749 [Amylocarpus encephaloides]
MNSVLIIGATGAIGSKIAKEIETLKSSFKRAAFLTPLADAGLEKEAKYAAIDLERVIGSLSDPASYSGFDIVVSAVGDDLCAQQPKFIDAAFAGGVKHFYPAEYGADLYNPRTIDEAYFVDKIAARKHLESRVEEEPSLGYTLIMVGLFSDYFLLYNILGLSEDRKSANFIGDPESVLSTTASDDVAKVVAASLLPTHLKSLAGKREVRFSGTTLQVKDLFATFELAQASPINVIYTGFDASFLYAKEQAALGNSFLAKFASAQRSIGFGGAEMINDDNKEYSEIIPTTWKQAVEEFLKK